MVTKKRALIAIDQLAELAEKYNVENHEPGVDQMDVAGTAMIAKDFLVENTAPKQTAVANALIALCKIHGIEAKLPVKTS